MQTGHHDFRVRYRDMLAVQKCLRSLLVTRSACLVVLALLSILNSGCSLCQKKNVWREPKLATARHPQGELSQLQSLLAGKDPQELADKGPRSLQRHFLFSRDPEAALDLAELAYQRAEAAAQASDGRCIDAYYEALVYSWICVQGCRSFVEADSLTARAWDVYHSSLAQLITAGQQYGRLDPHTGLTICTPRGPLVIPMSFHGFPWQPKDFSHLICVGSYCNKNIRHHYQTCGLGVPLVVVRDHSAGTRPFKDFYLHQTPFAATAFLCPDVNQWLGCEVTSGSACQPRESLALYDPLRSKTISCAGVPSVLAGDLTAPLAYLGREANWSPLVEFAKPETDPSLAGLRILEPYQPGKIPLVFVHGLFSDPQTYLAMANRIRACPDLDASYQIWVFRYPTGGTFLQSAASLRSQLRALVAICRSRDQNPALEQIVMVGHSLGGLITKLQVTDSGTTLWDSIARCPLNQIVASDQERAQLAEQFFFLADPSIKSVIFLATPQGGTPYASRPVGKLASRMVKYSPQLSAKHQQLIKDNPGVFAPVMQRRIPTSIDLMEPDDPLLLGMQRLHVNPCVRMHSIIGTGGCRLSTLGESDGIVPVSSARQPGVQSELYVDAIHTDILRNDVAIAEVERILRAHAWQARTTTTSQESGY